MSGHALRLRAPARHGGRNGRVPARPACQGWLVGLRRCRFSAPIGETMAGCGAPYWVGRDEVLAALGADGPGHAGSGRCTVTPVLRGAAGGHPRPAPPADAELRPFLPAPG